MSRLQCHKICFCFHTESSLTKGNRQVFGGRAHLTSAEQQRLGWTDSSHLLNQGAAEDERSGLRRKARTTSLKQVDTNWTKTIPSGPAGSVTQQSSYCAVFLTLCHLAKVLHSVSRVSVHLIVITPGFCGQS